MSDPSDFLVSATLLRRGDDTANLVGQLSERLTRALPDRVVVRHSRLGGGRVKSLTVDLPPDRFRIVPERHGLVAWVDHVVRQVTIRSDEVTVDEWLDRLAVSLSNEARRSVEARFALQDALQ